MGKLLRKRRQRQSARTRDLSNLQGWLHARGAMWSPKITYAANGVAGLGLGLVATKPLAAGEVLFVAPQGARLASRDRGDTQRRTATKLLREARRGARSRWRPFLRTLRPAACPWTWSRKDRDLLDGTELEAAVQLKVARLDAERPLVAEALGARVSRRTYATACAVVASHGPGALTPFAGALNHGPGHVVLEEVDGQVIGRARHAVDRPGELFTTYAYAHARLIYEYGFVPEATGLLPEDVVSVTLSIITAACGDDETPVGRLLLLANACDEAPWDGLSDVLACEIGAGGAGLARLVVCCFALDANALALVPKLQRAPPAAAASSDAWAASLAWAMVDGGEVADFQAIAAAHEDGDPWPHLLDACRVLDTKCFDNAVEIATECLQARRNALGADLPLREVLALETGEGEVVVQIAPPPPPGSPRHIARRLRSVERRLLDGALAVLAVREGVLP